MPAAYISSRRTSEHFRYTKAIHHILGELYLNHLANYMAGSGGKWVAHCGYLTLQRGYRRAGCNYPKWKLVGLQGRDSSLLLQVTSGGSGECIGNCNPKIQKGDSAACIVHLLTSNTVSEHKYKG